MYGGGRAPRWPSLFWWSALSLLPDVDVIGFSFGVEYGDPWGHRGATHSLAIASASGIIVGLIASRFERPALRTGLIAAALVASHGLLDTMTDGGLGCALLWPFDLTRYFAPWRPIPVAPIGPDFFSPHGAIVASIELVLFCPVWLFAWRPRIDRRYAALSLAPWAASVWLLSSGEPLREAIVGRLFREDTAFANGFSENAFRSISPGQPEADVRRLLGAPFRENWFYTPRGEPFRPALSRSAASLGPECLMVRSESGHVMRALDTDACKSAGVDTGMPSADALRVLGPPRESCLQYTWSRGEGFFRLRVVCFADGKVSTVIRRWQR